MTDAQLERQFQSLSTSMESLKSYVLDLRTEMIRRFDDTDQRLDTLAVTVGSIDSRLPGLTRAIMALESRVYKQADVGSPLLAKVAELEARIRKLEGAA